MVTKHIPVICNMTRDENSNCHNFFMITGKVYFINCFNFFNLLLCYIYLLTYSFYVCSGAHEFTDRDNKQMKNAYI